MKICEEYASLLDPFIDGELAGDEAARVREHLASCPACAAYAADAMAIRAAFGDMDETEVPEGLADGVMATIRAHAVPQKKKNQWVKVAASLAACALIVFAAVRVMPFSGSSGAAAPSLVSPAATSSSTSAAASDAADSGASTEMQTRNMENRSEAKADNDQLTAGSELEGSLYGAGAGSNEKTTAPAQAPESYGLAAPSDMQDAAGGGGASINAITSGNGASSGEDVWAENDNVVFASVVLLPPSQQLTDLLNGYEGKPYSNVNNGDTGTGYAMTSEEMETILDKIGYLQGPALNVNRTTDLCCIVVTDSGK